MRQIFIILSICFVAANIQAQWSETFSDGELGMNPEWKGDVDHMQITSQGELQLQADEAGVSRIYTHIDPVDSMRWEFYFRLDFKPSNSNNLKIFLQLNDTDLSSASGFYIQVGENGSQDAINFYKLEAGESILLATGTMGSLADQPAEARIRVDKDDSGYWEVSADYSINSNFEEEIQLFSSIDEFAGDLFMIECQYTSTRKDKFYFDDLTVNRLEKDTLAPRVENVVGLSKTEIYVEFSEPLNMESALFPENYFIDGGIGAPLKVEAGTYPNEVLLMLDKELTSGHVYLLSTQHVSDQSGNSMVQEFSFFLKEKPVPGELIINEILFDPLPGGGDFVELFNNSNKFLSLENIEIFNNQNGQNRQVLIERSLAPGEYIVFGEKIEFLHTQYDILFPERLVFLDLPAFNNDDGNVSIRWTGDGENSLIDEFNYKEVYHFTLFNDTEGISLERIRPNGKSNEAENWHSASSISGYATPGYQNSNYLEIATDLKTNFQVIDKVFSPNQDGDKDLLVINYNLESEGYVLNLKIYDVNGQMVRYLVQNELLSTSGVLSWDGTNENQGRLEVGIYIIWLELFKPTGKIERERLTCVLADFLDN